MSFVCLWSPTWPTGAAFPADLVVALLAEAPRLAVGEAGRVWADARGLSGGALAERLLEVAREAGVGDARAGVAMSAIAAEVGAVYGAVSSFEVRVSSEGHPLETRNSKLETPLSISPIPDRLVG